MSDARTRTTRYPRSSNAAEEFFQERPRYLRDLSSPLGIALLALLKAAAATCDSMSEERQ